MTNNINRKSDSYYTITQINPSPSQTKGDIDPVTAILYNQFQKILDKYRSGLVGDVKELQKLNKLLKTANQMLDLMRKILDPSVDPKALASDLRALADELKGNIKELGNGSYRRQLTDALNGIMNFLDNDSTISLLRDIQQDIRNYQEIFNELSKTFPDKPFIYDDDDPNIGVPADQIDNHPPSIVEKKAKRLKEILDSLSGNRGRLDDFIDYFQKEFGNLPESMHDIKKGFKTFFDQVMNVGYSTYRKGDFGTKQGTLKDAWLDSQKKDFSGLKAFLSAFIALGKDDSRSGDGWYAGLSKWQTSITGGNTLIDSIDRVDFNISTEQMIDTLRKMDDGDDILEDAFFSMWNNYQNASKKVHGIQSSITNFSNQSISDVNTRTTTLQAFTQTLNEMLAVPIHAINKSIAMVLKARKG